VAFQELPLGLCPERLRIEQEPVHVEDGGEEWAGQDEGKGGVGHGAGLYGERRTRPRRAIPGREDTHDVAQPNARVARLKRVIANRLLHPDRRLLLELLLRGAAAAFSALVILGLLPAITQAAA
jgi:hypothetical protein